MMAGGPAASEGGGPALGRDREEHRGRGLWPRRPGSQQPAPRGCPSVALRSCLGKKAGPVLSVGQGGDFQREGCEV